MNEIIFSNQQIEKLIELVRENKPLYDYKHKLYKRKNERYRLWVEIADQFDDLDLTAEACSAKWKSIKDYYLRKKKERIKDGQAGRKKRQWVFYEMLNFLDEIEVKHHTANSNIVYPESSFIDCDIPKTDDSNSEFIIFNAYNMDQTPDTKPETTKHTSSSERKRQHSESEEEETIKDLQNLSKKQIANEPDSIVSWCTSLIQPMRDLPTSARAEIRFKIEKLFYETSKNLNADL